MKVKVELDNTDMERIICSSAAFYQLLRIQVLPVRIHLFLLRVLYVGAVTLLFPCNLTFEVHTKFVHNTMPTSYFFFFFQNFN